MLKSSRQLAVLTFLAALCMMGCSRNKVFTDYAHVDDIGWRRADSVMFSVDSVSEDGEYYLKLGMRSDNRYPFMDIAVVVERRIFPRETLHRDTIFLDLINPNGHSRGKGVNVYQYLFDIDTLYLDKGDSVAVSVKHIMTTDTLTGISDIGIELRR